jgi:YHS domain-containing protein
MKQIPLNQKNSKVQVIARKNPVENIYRLSIVLLVLLLLSMLLLSCADKKKDAAESATRPTIETSQTANAAIASAQNYEIVPNEKVCMVNDRFMGVSQIPIDVNGTTYYGCCENCVEKLQKNIDDVRLGNNPLNKTKVDKASAVIVQDKSNGSVFYFASKEDAQDFVSKNKA